METTESETVPCMFCGVATLWKGTGQCDGCWLVSPRIEDFLHSKNGREFVRLLLAKADAEAGANVGPRDGVFRLMLTEVGEDKIAVVKRVREITNFGLREAKDFVDSVRGVSGYSGGLFVKRSSPRPRQLMRGRLADVEQASRLLTSAGATFSIEKLST